VIQTKQVKLQVIHSSHARAVQATQLPMIIAESVAHFENPAIMMPYIIS